MTDISSNQGSRLAPEATAPIGDTAPAVLHYRQAYEKALPAALALDVDDLIPINVDVPTAITASVGALPEILALRERVAAELPTFDLTHFDQLQTYTLAVGHAHARYLAASAGPEGIVALNEQGVTLRDTLYSDALALANRDIISGEKLGDFKANVGYKNLAFDLLGLAALLRQNWDKIASKTALQPSELDEAEFLGEQLVNAVGVREQAPAHVAEVSQQRNRHFTLFVKAYDQVRRAISYLRWDEDDLERIAPSLYAGRTTSRRKSDAGQPSTPPSTSVPAKLTGNPPGVPASPATSGVPGAAGAAPVGSAAPTTLVAPGLPGSTPFSTG